MTEKKGLYVCTPSTSLSLWCMVARLDSFQFVLVLNCYWLQAFQFYLKITLKYTYNIPIYNNTFVPNSAVITVALQRIIKFTKPKEFTFSYEGNKKRHFCKFCIKSIIFSKNIKKIQRHHTSLFFLVEIVNQSINQSFRVNFIVYSVNI